MARYAIMGTNYLSHIYRKAICDAGDEVIAVCSRSLERAKELGGEGVLAYTDLDEMLKNPDIDVVYLCIPNVLHAQTAIRCLKAGKHVLCEKPATISAAQMEAIIEAARESGRVFAEAVMNFYSPVMDKLRAELKEAAWRRSAGPWLLCAALCRQSVWCSSAGDRFCPVYGRSGRHGFFHPAL